MIGEIFICYQIFLQKKKFKLKLVRELLLGLTDSHAVLS